VFSGGDHGAAVCGRGGGMPADSEEEEHEPEKVGACREQVSDERGGGKKGTAPQDRPPLSRSLAAVGHQ